MLNKSPQESQICLPDHNNDIVRSANVEPSCNVLESSIARENLEVDNDQVAVEGGVQHPDTLQAGSNHHPMLTCSKMEQCSRLVAFAEADWGSCLDD
ncbi:hypothetical protein V6N12_028596 [Hibiscus sabdariffa]|uniref:Uncharacterized protein n=1 Tax=Hibiscus sabdariffa TaxID=183260 RepID=A0ABR2F6B6_9ROSI